MPLHLNLNHEREKLKAERARDPLKLTMMALSVVIAAFAAQYFWNIGKMASVNRQLTEKNNEFNQVNPRAMAAMAEEAELRTLLGNSDRIVKRIEGRFYWATLLDEVIRLVPREVQLTRFSGDAQGDFMKKVQFNLEGLSAGTDPRKVAEDLRHRLGETLGKRYKNVTSTFRHLEDNNEQAILDGKSLPMANFSINVQFQSGEDPAATPVPRTAKGR